jgi:hypothetical protein
MKNRRFWLGMLVIALVFGMTVVGCDDGSNNNNDPDPYVPPAQTPLTGTVTVSKDVRIDIGREKMTLTADVSGLNGNSTYYFYQWMKDGVNISGARSSTYDVTEADYGKTVRVKVTSSVLSGEQFGDFIIPNPTKLTLTLKWDNAAGKKDTGITIERENGGYWAGASTSGNLTTSGTTVILTSWTETKFKMRTTYKFVETNFYFKKDNALGSELFDLTNGTKTYTLTNVADSFGLLTGLFATEGS